jgi:hypothetical protein
MTTVTDRERIADLLPALVRVLGEARDATPGEASFDLVAKFLDGLVDVGRALRAEPALRAEADVDLFLRESGHQLAFLHPAVDHYRAITAHQAHGGWDGGVEWERLLRRRSALQFSGELYGGTDYDGFFDLLELDEVDDVIRDRGRSEGFPNSFPVPADIPPTHWWWWYPRTPPTP